MAGMPGFFDVDERLRRLSELGDQLEVYARAVDFEAFRPDLEKTLAYSTGCQGGRPPYDPVLMLKILVSQAANGLSDERAEFLISDRPARSSSVCHPPLDQIDEVADIFEGPDLGCAEPHVELAFNSQHQGDMRDGVPLRDVGRR